MHATPPLDRIGATIRERMTRANLTQTIVSAATGISQPALSKKLSGEVAFRLDEVFRISALLGVPASELLEEAERAA